MKARIRPLPRGNNKGKQVISQLLSFVYKDVTKTHVTGGKNLHSDG
jgi:hypothetical protein